MYSYKLPKLFQPFDCDSLYRLGKDNDGGYIVNSSDVAISSKLISLGIGTDWSFEKHFLSFNNCKLEAYDGSLNITDEVKQFFMYDRKIHQKNIGDKEGEVPFSSIINGHEIFLKCDIEGSEYGILNDIINHTSRFSGLIIEFHNINDPENFNDLINFVSKINQKIVHVHVNNYFYYKTPTQNIPDILEITFSSSKNIRYNQSLTLPRNLDMPNNPKDEEFKLFFK